LPEVPVVTGEEEEDTIAKFRSKIYRWKGEWKERGVGEMKFLKHKTTGLIRILVRA
jgi:Ran-binding protein 1